MSKKEVKSTEEKQEKVVTKYDRKMQKRAEEKAKAAKEQKISMITGIAIVAVLVCFVASFPIRTWFTVNGTYVKVGGEKVSRLEFDYNYHVALNNYQNIYGAYLSYMGVDLTGDLSRQMYSQDMTFQDYFEEMAMDTIVQNRALTAQAEAAGFTYDASAAYEEYEASLKEAAETAGMSERDFVKDSFGVYATPSRLKKIVMQNLTASAYYDSIVEEKTPDDETAKAYYEENRDTYDSVDYRVVTVNAELPTEPTDLADPVEEKETAEDGTGDETTADETYEPSEAEIAFAMKLAKTEAENAVKTVAEDGTLQQNMKRSGIASLMRDWLFDSGRKAGDTTIIENETSHLYYVLAFEKRYLDETPTVDVRAVVVEEEQGETVLDEWKNGEATEDSFAELADKYNNPDVTTAEGGLFDNMLTTSVPDEIAEWLEDGSRAYGDTTVIKPGDDYSYVLYYIGTDEPQWMLDVKDALLADIMSDYIDEITEGFEVEDTKNRLNYLQVYAAREAAEAESSASDAAESGASDGMAESGGSEAAESSEAGSSAQ